MPMTNTSTHSSSCGYLSCHRPGGLKCSSETIFLKAVALWKTPEEMNDGNACCTRSVQDGRRRSCTGSRAGPPRFCTCLAGINIYMGACCSYYGGRSQAISWLISSCFLPESALLNTLPKLPFITVFNI